jgi:hypothetical protein
MECVLDKPVLADEYYCLLGWQCDRAFWIFCECIGELVMVLVVLQQDTTQKYIYHKNYHTTLEQNTAHMATQTIKDTLRTMNTTQKK